MEMKRNDKDYLLALKDIEHVLNELSFKQIPIGSLLAKYFSILYLRNNGVYSSKKNIIESIKYSLSLFKFILLGLFRKKTVTVTNNHILFNKLANRPHLQRMIDPLVAEYKSKCLIYTPSKENQIKPYNFVSRVYFRSFFLIAKNLTLNFKQIKQTFYEKQVVINSWELLYTIFVQLIHADNWIRFFEQNKIKLVVVDFDRDYRTSPMVLAAKQANVKTITLVHGVLNPPFAYVPVLADYIFCWGNYQKKQLISYGVPEDKIVITGNPIAEDNKSEKEENGKNKSLTIGIGLNPMPDKKNLEILKYLWSNQFSDNVDWVIKLHPAMKKEKWDSLIPKRKVKVFDSLEITNENFFKKIDLLFISNSGLGFEAISANVPVWVFRVSKGKSGNDGVMINEANAPDVSNENVFLDEFQMFLKDEKYTVNLLKKQKAFVNNEFYFATGNKASLNMIKEIDKLIER